MKTETKQKAVKAAPVVKGYQPQSPAQIEAANEVKKLEERFMRLLDDMRDCAVLDQRCVSEARTCIQTGAMWAVRAIFQPQRIKLDGDPKDE